jgi:hypothetical protein
LLARFDEPEPFVDAAGDLGEEIGGIGVLQFAGLRAGVAGMFAKGGQRRRKRIDVAIPLGRCQPSAPFPHVVLCAIMNGLDVVGDWHLCNILVLLYVKSVLISVSTLLT